MKSFVAVNFNTSYLIAPYVESVYRAFAGDEYEIILIDNYSNDKERSACRALCEKFGLVLIPNENSGYGAALNKGFSWLVDAHRDGIVNRTIFAGNLDIEYLKAPTVINEESCAYVPKVLEGGKNINPFLTALQRKCVGLYLPAARWGNRWFLRAAIALNHLIGFIHSPIWTIHGSLFVFSGAPLLNDPKVFNDDSFLYCEELEFGTYVEKHEMEFVETDCTISHVGGVATSIVIRDMEVFIRVWSKSFFNWRHRDSNSG